MHTRRQRHFLGLAGRTQAGIEGGNGLAIQLPQFGQFGQQGQLSSCQHSPAPL